MRVSIINQYADAPDRPVGTRHYTLARAVARRGGQVTVFAAAFDHAVGRDTRLRPLGLVTSRLFDGVRFVWVRTVPYRGNSWRRMANMASFAVMVVIADLGRPRPDIVVGSTVHPFAALAAWVIAKRRRASFVYEIRDLWPQTLIDIGAMRPNSLGARLLYGIESFLARRADVIVTLLPGVGDYLAGRGLPSQQVRYLPNGADFSLTDGPVVPPKPGDPFHVVLERLRDLRASGVMVFAYVGSHGRVNRLDVVLRAVRAAQDLGAKPFRLVLVGDGPEKPELIRLAAELSLDSVDFLEPVPKSRVPALLAMIDVGIVHATYTPVYRYGISFNKVFDYMAARKPIAFACAAINDPVKASGGGISVSPDDPDALGGAFAALTEMSEADRRALGEAGRRYVEQEHDMQQIGDWFAAILEAQVRGDGGLPLEPYID